MGDGQWPGSGSHEDQRGRPATRLAESFAEVERYGKGSNDSEHGSNHRPAATLNLQNSPGRP